MPAKSLFSLTWQTTRIAILLALLLGAVFVPTQTAAARATTFTVNTTADTNDASAGNGVCADASGQCSLRAAITEASALAGDDTINLPAGIYQLTRANAGGVNDDGNSTGDLDIYSSLTITGAGAGSTIIQAGTNTDDGIDKVFGVNPYCISGVSVTIQDVTIRYGRNTQPYGAAEYSYTGGGLDWCGGTGADSFTLKNAVVSDNTVANGYGGGLNIDSVSDYTGAITIDTVTFQNNRTTGNIYYASGGALNVYAHQPNITISNSEFTNNQVASSTASGGAIYLGPRYGGSVQIHNSLIQGNTTNSDGGGIAIGSFNSGTTITIDQNTRILNNTAGRYGGGIYMFPGTATNATPYLVTNTLVSGNTATGNQGGGMYFDCINATVQYSRILNNTASSGSGLQKSCSSTPAGTVTAEKNWWGCSAGPGATGCDTAVVTGGALDFNPWLQARLTATPTTVVNGQTSALVLSFLKASDNSDISASNLGQFVGLSAIWAANPTLGSISGQTTIQTDGRATATFTATGAGTTLLSARVDNDATGSGTSTQSVLVVNPPTVTINKAAAQLDPVNTGPINFTVVFSEAMTGFGDATDVTLGGTAPGTLSKTITEIAPNNGTTFNVAVSGMTGSGTVLASVPAGAAQNASAVSNVASTSTDNSVIYDVAPPETSITGNPPDPSNSATANFTFSGSDSGGAGVSSFECQLDGGGFSACTSPKQYTDLADSSHTFNVFARDAAGNADASPAAYTWTVDTTVATTTTLGSSANPSSYTWSVTFTATVSPAPTGGTVEFRDGGVTIPGCAAQALTGGQATCVTSALPVGSHNITAVYSGSAVFQSSTSAPLVQVVNQQNTSLGLTSNINPSHPTQFVTFTANLRCCGAPGSPLTGELVTFKDGETVIGTGTTDGSGNATFSTADLTVGAHNITAVFAGNANFLGSTSNSVSQSVQQIATEIELISGTNPSTYGQSVTFTATVRCCGAPGSPVEGVNVTFKDGETILGTGTTNSSGEATYITSTLATGSHSITAIFAGTIVYVGSTSPIVTQVVELIPTQTLLTSDPNPSFHTQSVTFTATISPTPTTGTVEFRDGSVTISGCGTQALTGGQATCTTSALTAGDHSVTAVYSGATNFESSTSPALTQVVNQASPAITSANNVTFTVGTTSSFTVTTTGFPIPAISRTGALPTGVTFVDNGNGTATLSGTPAAGTAGTYPLTITASNGVPPNATQNFTFTVGQAPTITSPNNVTFAVGAAGSFTVMTAGFPIPAISRAGALPSGMTFVDNRNGTATLSGTPATGSVGTYPLTITASNSILPDATQNFTLTIDQASTTTTITSDVPDPSVYGQTVTFTYTVSVVPPGAGTPTGNVTVSNGTVSCTDTVAAGSCSITFIGAGTSDFTANYAGDASFAGSTSAAVPHTVNKANTTTAITSDAPDPSQVGEPVTVNFTVTVVAPGTGTPTGNVIVSSGTDSCTGTVTAGTCTITFSSAGPKTLTAAYAGNTNFNGSTSPSVGHTVTMASTTINITSDAPDPSIAGVPFPVTYTVTVAAPGGGAPTGTVTVTDGVNNCMGTVAAGSCDLTLTTVGGRLLTASYSGDANYGGSTSLFVDHTVVGPPAVTLINSSADTGDGQIDENERTDADITQLLVVFNKDMNADTSGDLNDALTVGNYSLVQGGSTVIPINPVITYNAGTHTATLDVNGGAALPNGEYTLTVLGRIEDTLGVPIGTDFIRHFYVGYGAGIYDDTDPQWTYTGSWTPASGVTGPYANTHSYTGTVGNYAEFQFVGVKFKLTYVKASNRGLIDVYVDGTKIERINAYSSTLSWQQTWMSPTLTAGPHTVRFVHAGGHRYIDIDALEVFPAGTAGPGIYDDTQYLWNFSNGWTNITLARAFNNTDHYTSVVGSDAQLTFNGNRFIFTYIKSYNRGLIDVYIDGVKVGTINAKDTTTTWQATWTSPTLTAGTHTVRFVHAGGGTYIDVDAIEILGPAETIAPSAITDLSGAGGASTGTVSLTWTAPGDDGSTGTATSYLIRYSTAAISDEATWNAATPMTTGIPTPAAAGATETMTTSGLTPGANYFFAVRAQDEEGNLGGCSNSPSITVQSFTPVTVGTYDDRDVNWIYSGTWEIYNGGGPANNTSRYASTSGSEAQLTFEGAQFIFTYVKSSNRGSIDVYVDGTKITTLNAKSTTTAWQATWTSPAFVPGVHTVRFVHAGGGTYIDVDKIQIFGAVSAGDYDDTDANWVYSGTWTSYTGTGPLNGTNHYTSVAGSEAQLTFTGTGFTLTYVESSNRGSIDVYVDGVKVGTINAKDTTTTWQVTWTSPTLTAGTHTVRFVHAGGGTYIDVDAITILP